MQCNAPGSPPAPLSERTQLLLAQEKLGVVARLCSRISQGVYALCNDPARRSERHRVKWWLLGVNESAAHASMDRLDLELLLHQLRVEAGEEQVTALVGTLLPESGLRFSCQELAKLLGLGARVRDFSCLSTLGTLLRIASP